MQNFRKSISAPIRRAATHERVFFEDGTSMKRRVAPPGAKRPTDLSKGIRREYVPNMFKSKKNSTLI